MYVAYFGLSLVARSVKELSPELVLITRDEDYGVLQVVLVELSQGEGLEVVGRGLRASHILCEGLALAAVRVEVRGADAALGRWRLAQLGAEGRRNPKMSLKRGVH